MSLKELKIAELLCTRLVHDITGPIGAVNNGAEFLKEEGSDMQGQAIQLIIGSATEAVNRLQYYRKAYGRINDDGEASLADNKKIATDFFSGTKISLDWPDLHTDASGISVSRKMARLVLNLLIIAAGSLIRGGTIAVRLQRSEKTDFDMEITITATGSTVRWDKEMEQALSGSIASDDLTPKTVQPYLTRMLAEEISTELQWKNTDTVCTLTILHRQASLQF
jgi:histidine phosphotransferase ChpT